MCLHFFGALIQTILEGQLLGKVVRTPYNDKTYTIGGIVFNKNPTMTYKDGCDETFLQYYARVGSPHFQLFIFIL